MESPHTVDDPGAAPAEPPRAAAEHPPTAAEPPRTAAARLRAIPARVGAVPARLRNTWARLDRRGRVLAVGGAAAGATGVVILAALGVLAASGAFTAAAPTPSPSPTPGPTATPTPSPAPTPTPSSSPTPTPSPTPPGADPLLGLDGRLTVLLLGSDYRPAHPGNRTDAIMVVTVDPTTGRSAAVSIPRDTTRFPLPDGGVFSSKVNALYGWAVNRSDDAGAFMRGAVSKALEVEIDGYVFIGFAGFRNLVDAVGGIDVVLETAYADPYFWVNGRTRGVYFPAGVNHLAGDRALILARSRKGDNDFGRARRQQLIVMAAVDKVRQRGLEALPALIDLARDYVRTDLSLDQSVRLFELIATADLEGSQRVVVGPRSYAESTGGTGFQLKLDVVRALVAKWFAPVPGSPAAPTPSPSPTPSPGPSPSPTPSPGTSPSPSSSASP